MKRGAFIGQQQHGIMTSSQYGNIYSVHISQIYLSVLAVLRNWNRKVWSDSDAIRIRINILDPD